MVETSVMWVGIGAVDLDVLTEIILQYLFFLLTFSCLLFFFFEADMHRESIKMLKSFLQHKSFNTGGIHLDY